MMGSGEIEQRLQRGERAGRQDVRRVDSHLLHTLGAHVDVEPQFPRGTPEKSAFAAVALDEGAPREAVAMHDRRHDPRQATPRPDIDPSTRRLGQALDGLHAIENMPLPDVGLRRRRDQVDPPRPLQQERGIRPQHLLCFT